MDTAGRDSEVQYLFCIRTRIHMGRDNDIVDRISPAAKRQGVRPWVCDLMIALFSAFAHPILVFGDCHITRSRVPGTLVKVAVPVKRFSSFCGRQIDGREWVDKSSLCSAAIVVVELTVLGNAIAGVKVSEVGKGVERKILVLLFESKRGE